MTTRAAEKKYLDAVVVLGDYLHNRAIDLPFQTGDTFYYRTEHEPGGKVFNGSPEWYWWSQFVRTLAEEFDRTYYLDLLDALHRHLVIGWLLSSVTFEIEHGPVRDRRYGHASYAGWRTFDGAFDDRGDCPFKRDSKLSVIPSVQALHASLVGVIIEWQSGMEEIGGGRLRDTAASDVFIKDCLPEMQRLIRIEYDAAAQEIRRLMGSRSVVGTN